MYKNEEYKLSIKIDSLGPFQGKNSINQTLSVQDKKRFVIFARNGAGKTCISRALSLLNPDNSLVHTDYSKLISNGSRFAAFRLKLDELEYGLEINPSGIFPTNTDGHIFHVFNTDFIDMNIRDLFSSDRINGYILGKENIDVHKELEQKEKIDNKIESLTEDLEQSIKSIKDELCSVGVNPNTQEFKSITLERVLKMEPTEEELSFDELNFQYTQLLNKQFDSIHSIKMPDLDINDYTSLSNIFDRSYGRIEQDSHFLYEVEQNLDFFNKGVGLYDSDKNRCPFCRQEMSPEAIHLIERYRPIIEGEKAKTIKSLQQYSENINGTISRFNKFVNEFNSEVNTYNEDIGYFDHLGEKLPSIDVEPINNELLKIQQLIKDKIKDMSLTFTYALDQLKYLYSDLNVKVDTANSLFDKINNRIFERKNEELSKRRRICNAAFNRLIDSNVTTIQEIKALSNEESELERSIKEKQSKSQKLKLSAVTDCLVKLVDFFFPGKYRFEQSDYSIRFTDGSYELGQLMSEGEKTIIAFCYYIASTHTLVSMEDDYSKILFVIDDPISSLDFDHIYAVTHLFKSTWFPYYRNHIRQYVVFTHNIDFFNLLVTGRVSANYFILKGNSFIPKTGQKLLLPYELHLNDVRDVAKGLQPPQHTTPNSIRHILETIAKFEKPDGNLNEFLEEYSSYFSNSSIYQLIEDMSHGKMRESIINEDVVVDCCKCTINFIDKRYPHQLGK